MAELTPKQRRFVEEYCKDFNGTQAAIRAGYSAKTAGVQSSDLLKKPDIQATVREFLNSKTEDAGITVDYVLNTIKNTIERCSQAKPVYDSAGRQKMTEDANGMLVPAYQFDSGAVLKGSELLGRYLKIFTDKVDHTSSDGTMSPPPPLYKIVKK